MVLVIYWRSTLQNVKIFNNGFIHFYLPFLIKVDAGETKSRDYLLQCLKKKKKKKNTLFLFAAVLGYCKHCIVNKPVHCFDLFASAFCKILVQTILQDFSSLFTHKTSKERHKTHTPYAGTAVLQTLCVDSALRLELTKGTCNQRRKYFACSIVSRDICLQLTKITRDFANVIGRFQMNPEQPRVRLTSKSKIVRTEIVHS